MSEVIYETKTDIWHYMPTKQTDVNMSSLLLVFGKVICHSSIKLITSRTWHFFKCFFMSLTFWWLSFHFSSAFFSECANASLCPLLQDSAWSLATCTRVAFVCFYLRLQLAYIYTRLTFNLQSSKIRQLIPCTECVSLASYKWCWRQELLLPVA